MLFIAMIEAAALAASSASGERCSFASLTIAAIGIARGERRRDEGAPPLLLAEQRVHHEGGENEPLVPGIFGELFFQGFDRHRILRVGMRRVAGAAIG